MRGNTATYEEVRAERIEASRVEGDHYRALAASDDREVNPNWWVINEPEVEKAVRQASAKIRARFGDTFETEDLESEAWIAAARIADRAAACLAGENGHNMGTFQHELEMDLVNLCGPVYGRHNKTYPHEPDVLALRVGKAQQGDSRHTRGRLPSTDGEDIPESSTWGHTFRGGSDIDWSQTEAGVL